MITQREHWQKLRRGILLLIEALAVDIGEKNKEILVDFVDNREFGVALEWLYSLIRENQILLSTDQNDLIQHLADLMNIKLFE
jgi:hypothetical protein